MDIDWDAAIAKLNEFLAEMGSDDLLTSDFVLIVEGVREDGGPSVHITSSPSSPWKRLGLLEYAAIKERRRVEET